MLRLMPISHLATLLAMASVAHGGTYTLEKAVAPALANSPSARMPAQQAALTAARVRLAEADTEQFIATVSLRRALGLHPVSNSPSAK